MGQSTNPQISGSPAHQIGRMCRDSLLAIGVAVGLAACSGGAEEETAPVRPVKIIEVSTGADVRTQSLPAVIEAARSSDLTFEINGTLQEMLVREGDNVRQGQVLARLDPRTYQNDLATARAEYNNANAEYQRASRLVAEDAIAQNVYEQRRTAREVARAQFDTARVRLDDTVLRAPFSGVVARTYVERFENIGAQQEILTLQTQGQARAVVQVPATIVANSGQIRPLGSVMTLDAAPDVEMPATIYSTSTQADPSSQTFEVRFNFTPPSDTLILPGMTGTVRARLELEEGGIVPEGVSVPLAAIQSDGDDRYVWLVDEETMTVSRRDVVVASADGEMMTVTSGLRRGDKIAGAGASYLHEGMEIRPYEE
ncbi:efflux RND transporter periplasmic adaptor subunit [Parasphingopyxis sp. CP4]|uniref:efflux RND transporter periplasmic adaptor subunit n=1 Tax=Parasphingopyxis sp. CP4 TaxID=2724527 RepID=UPI0015A44F9B|nr:efflux RND transporter periplasmic adaptor subunit [Parasphingopyxis sp. CP4]QLC22018.1 efflux RND transporter periplasmic adaptor subunit [Parasphingopyxis sp. CP4]